MGLNVVPGWKMPPLAGSAPLPQEVAFWIWLQLICEVLRAVMMLSIASSASCLAIRFSCEVWVVAMARPNTPSRLTMPTVRMTIEIRTSISENPLSDGFRVRAFVEAVVVEPVIAEPIDTLLPMACCRAAIHAAGRYR